MFKSLMAFTLLLASITAVAYAAPPGLIVTKDGYYSVTVGADGVPVTEKITQVMVLGAPTVPPGGGGGGGTTPPTPTDELASKIAAMSKVKLPDAGEGTALAAAVNMLLAQNLDAAGYKSSMDITVPFLGGALNAKTRIDAWYAALQKVEGFSFTKAGMQSTLIGLVAAYDIDPDILKSVTDTAIEAEAKDIPPETAAAAMETQFENAAFDFTAILSIIMAIIELLRNAGIIKI